MMAVRVLLKRWSERYFSDEEAVILFFVLLLGFAGIILLGKMLAPFLASVVIAFLLNGLVHALERWHVPRMLAVSLVSCLFIGILFAALFILLPLIWNQLLGLSRELPGMIQVGQTWLASLQDTYPTLISESHVNAWIAQAGQELGQIGQKLISASLSSIPSMMALIVYLVLVPILVFFLLKDQGLLIHWCASWLPNKRRMLGQVWTEMDKQIANYIRGKAIEIVIVGAATYVGLVAFGMQYAALLALLVGLSVLIPYIGAAVVTVPVALIAIFQFGWSDTFIYIMITYGIIQALDGNVLVPLLFSEAVNLHPVAIILAVLFFGGLWGFWGVFFAIPLATLCKAVLNAWPSDFSKE